MRNISAPVSSQSPTSAPDMANYVTSAKFAKGDGIELAELPLLFFDFISGGTISNMQNQQYQNAYNQWMYENYQSPAALARQYEQAGLNRNFAQNGPQGNVQPSASANLANNSIGNSLRVIQGINTYIKTIAEGVGLIENLAMIPKDQAFKEWRNIAKSFDASIAESRATSALAKAVYDSIYYRGVHLDSFIENGNLVEPMFSPAITQAGLRNDVMELMKGLRKYDLDNMKPMQYKILERQFEDLGYKMGIDRETLDWFSTNQVSRILLPFLMFLGKFM